MAKGRQLGFGSLMYGMIVFVALWLTSTVLLVILYAYTNRDVVLPPPSPPLHPFLRKWASMARALVDVPASL